MILSDLDSETAFIQHQSGMVRSQHSLVYWDGPKYGVTNMAAPALLPILAGPAAMGVYRSIGAGVAAAGVYDGLQAIFNHGPAVVRQPGDLEIKDMAIGDLVNRVEFQPVINITPTIQQETNEALQRFAEDKDNVTLLQTRVENIPQTVDAEISSNVAGADPYYQAARAQAGAPDNLVKKEMNVAARKQLNNAIRKDGDGWRVSKEEHEFNYCKVFQISKIFGIGSVAEPAELTYGAFVESPLMRKQIAKWRRLRATAFSKNSKMLATLLGTTREQILIDLEAAGTFPADCTTAADEFVVHSP